MRRFEGERAFVTGAASGIGRAIAKALALEGASVTVVDRDEAGLQSLAVENGVKLIAIDLGDHDRLRSVLSEFPAYSLLVNAAAVSLPDTLSLDDSAWSRTLGVNLEAARIISLALAKTMPIDGRIVNLTSIHGRLCERGSLAYGVGKAALDQLTRCLAVELAPRRILVNAIAPGFVDTPMSRASGVNELETEWFRQGFIESGRIPLQRPAQAEEIAPVALFLLSRENSYLTGQVIAVDGGLSLTL